MSTFLTTTAYVSSDTHAVASSKLYLIEADVTALTALSNYRPSRDPVIFASGAHSWVSGYTQRGPDGNVVSVSTTPTMTIAEAASVPISKCRSVTFTAVVDQGWASMVGTILGPQEGGFLLIFPIFTRLVYNAATGEIRHRVDVTVQEGAERDDDRKLDEDALRDARYLMGDTGDELAVLRSDRPLPIGRAFRVDTGTRELVAQPDRDLPDRPWLTAR
jgi:hypothetical protein